MSAPLPKSLAWFMFAVLSILLAASVSASCFLLASVPRGWATTGLIDLNRADASDLVGLPGIDWGIAGAIVDERREHGDFSSFEDVDVRVRGVGTGRRETLRGACFVRVRVPRVEGKR